LRHGRQMPGNNGIIRATASTINAWRTDMTGIEEIHRLIDAFENNTFTTGEFQNLAIVQLAKLSAAEQRDALATLSAHAHEDVRNIAVEFRLLQCHEALSKSIDYIRRISPLRPGGRLELSGGYDYYSPERPAWLKGRDYYMATFLGFASYGENTIPTALVEFDEIIEGPGYKGRYGVLFARFGPTSIAWGQAEDVVEVYVKEALPEDVTLIRFYRASGSEAETHATYPIEETA
jgi:hypothetical protein